MDNAEIIKKAVDKLTGLIGELTQACSSLQYENTSLKNQLQDIRVAIGHSLETTATTPAKPIATVTAIKSKTPRSPKATKAKRGRKFLFSDDEVIGIRAQHDKGISVLELAKAFKVSPPTIYNALTRGLSPQAKVQTNGGTGAGKH